MVDFSSDEAKATIPISRKNPITVKMISASKEAKKILKKLFMLLK